MKKWNLLPLLFFSVSGLGSDQNHVQTKVLLSPVYTIDRKYLSMEGPNSTQPVYLIDSEKPELLWITGIQTEMMKANGESPSSPDFMCHVNLDFNLARRKAMYGYLNSTTTRLLTLSQGQLKLDLPRGFGLPILSSEPLDMATQVLNLNIDHPHETVRHKVTFKFIKDSEAGKPIVPLFNIVPFVLVQDTITRESPLSMESSSPVDVTSCLPGQHAPNGTKWDIFKDVAGNKITGHWVVKPGWDIHHTNVTGWMNLPFDTTMHAAAVHLHPFAVSLALRDLTTGKEIFKSKARSSKGKIGLEDVSSFASVKGIPLYKNHEYELVSTYHNTTDHDVDSMATMLIYARDMQFKKPSPALLRPVKNVTMPAAGPERILMRTSLGNLLLTLYPDVAPETVRRILALVRAGVYDSTAFDFIYPGFVAQTSLADNRATALTEKQESLVTPLPLEPNTLPHERGVLSMGHEERDPDTALSSFSIVLGRAPQLDQRYTVFGKVEQGWNVLEAFEKIPLNAKHVPVQRVTILNAEVVSSTMTLKGRSDVKNSAPKKGADHSRQD